MIIADTDKWGRTYNPKTQQFFKFEEREYKSAQEMGVSEESLKKKYDYADTHRQLLHCSKGCDDYMIDRYDYKLWHQQIKTGAIRMNAICPTCKGLIQPVKQHSAEDNEIYFGKYSGKGKTIGWVCKNDRSYAQWVSENLDGKSGKDFKEVLDDTPVEESDTYLDTPFTITRG